MDVSIQYGCPFLGALQILLYSDELSGHVSLPA